MSWTGDFANTRTLDIAPEAIVEGSMFAERYAIEERLGAGAQSTVFAALDMLSSPPQRVALKIARADKTSLLRETELLACAHHDRNIDGLVRLVEPEVQTFGAVDYLVLEHIDGPTLRNAVLSLPEVCRVGGFLARALAAIHEAGIIVADVKPDNILLRHGTEPVLIDLGAARKVDERDAPILLTPAYASPEQLAGQAPSFAGDVYALAVLLEEKAGPNPPRRFVATINRGKALDPAERPTAEAFAQALEDVGVSRGYTRRQWLVVGGMLMVTGLAGCVAWFVGRTRVHAESAPKPYLAMISTVGAVLHLALGESHVYWSDGNGRTVFRAPIAGGPAQVVTQLETPAHQLAVSGDIIFVRGPGTIWSFWNRKLERFAESTGRGGIVADDRSVVWTNEDSGEVVTASVRGDAPLRVLAHGRLRPYAVTMDATHVYWANEGDGTLARVSRAGGEVEILVRGQSWPVGTLVDETHLYWLDRTAGAILRIPKGGGVPQWLAKPSVGSLAMAFGGTHVYWAGTEDSRVMRVPKTGGATEVLLMGQPRPYDIVVRGNEVFFSNNYLQGGVMRLVLP